MIENVRTVRLYGTADREVARFQGRLDQEHVLNTRVAFLQGNFIFTCATQLKLMTFVCTLVYMQAPSNKYLN